MSRDHRSQRPPAEVIPHPRPSPPGRSGRNFVRLLGRDGWLGCDSWIAPRPRSREHRDRIRGRRDAHTRCGPRGWNQSQYVPSHCSNSSQLGRSRLKSRRPSRRRNGTWFLPRCRARRSSCVLHPSVCDPFHPPLGPTPSRDPKLTLERSHRG